VRQFGETLAQCIARVSQRIMKLDGGTEDQQPLASVSIEARLRS
jgi:hypothetical protein